MRKISVWKRPRILILVLAAAGIFLTFQFFSLKALFYTQKRSSQASYVKENERMENFIEEFNDEDSMRIHPSEAHGVKHLSIVPRGVHIDDMHLYKAVQQGHHKTQKMFRCVKTEVRICNIICTYRIYFDNLIPNFVWLKVGIKPL